MIYFIYGTDTEAARVKAVALADSLQKKKPDAGFFKLTAEDMRAGGQTASSEFAGFDQYTQSQGLFEHKSIVFLDRVGEDKSLREELIDNLEIMAESPNIFILLEGKLDKATAGKISKKAEKTQEFEKEKTGDEKDGWANKSTSGAPSIFALADALGQKDRKKMWILYREQIDGGASPEEIHGTLFWQVKSMILAARTKSASESGLSPYVHTKSAGYARNFSAAELDELLGKLISISHDARRGKHELETALEAMMLGV